MSSEIYGLIGLAIGAVVGFFLDRLLKGSAYRTSDQLVEDAQREADNIRKTSEIEAKEELLKRRESMEGELNQLREKVRQEERRVDKREAALEEMQGDIRKKEQMLQTMQKRTADRAKAVETREAELEKILQQEQDELFKITGLDKAAATEKLLNRLGQQLQSETGAAILKHEAHVKEEQERMAREIIGMAVQRYASQHTSETTVSTVDIPNDEMKGRIIGREGRNIRAFEKETGVDVIVDDTPGVVVVSAFDNVRREIAKLSLSQAHSGWPHSPDTDRGSRHRNRTGDGRAHQTVGA